MLICLVEMFDAIKEFRFWLYSKSLTIYPNYHPLIY